MHTRTIVVMGLNTDEIDIVKKNVPHKECEIIDIDDVRDILAMSEFAVIVRADTLKNEDMNLLYEFYSEIAPFSETVMLIGKAQVPDILTRNIMVYADFEELKDKLKYVLLSAYRRQKKSENFSATLANAITILSLIRKQPHITSAELADKLELSQRSIQRYIETLRVAGEWIEYDTEKKGWILTEGKSVLWGDF